MLVKHITQSLNESARVKEKRMLFFRLSIELTESTTFNLREKKIMANEKVSFREFLSAVEPEHRVFVEELNNKLIEQGCNLVRD